MLIGFAVATAAGAFSNARDMIEEADGEWARLVLDGLLERLEVVLEMGFAGHGWSMIRTQHSFLYPRRRSEETDH